MCLLLARPPLFPVLFTEEAYLKLLRKLLEELDTDNWSPVYFPHPNSGLFKLELARFTIANETRVWRPAHSLSHGALTGSSSWMPLSMKAKVVDMILEFRHRLLYDAPDDGAQWLFLQAAFAADPKLVQVFVDRGMDADVRPEGSFWTPRQAAFIGGNPGTIAVFEPKGSRGTAHRDAPSDAASSIIPLCFSALCATSPTAPFPIPYAFANMLRAQFRYNPDVEFPFEGHSACVPDNDLNPGGPFRLTSRDDPFNVVSGRNPSPSRADQHAPSIDDVSEEDFEERTSEA